MVHIYFEQWNVVQPTGINTFISNLVRGRKKREKKEERLANKTTKPAQLQCSGTGQQGRLVNEHFLKPNTTRSVHHRVLHSTLLQPARQTQTLGVTLPELAAALELRFKL